MAAVVQILRVQARLVEVVDHRFDVVFDAHGLAIGQANQPFVHRFVNFNAFRRHRGSMRFDNQEIRKLSPLEYNDFCHDFRPKRCIFVHIPILA